MWCSHKSSKSREYFRSEPLWNMWKISSFRFMALYVKRIVYAFLMLWLIYSSSRNVITIRFSVDVLFAGNRVCSDKLKWMHTYAAYTQTSIELSMYIEEINRNERIIGFSCYFHLKSISLPSFSLSFSIRRYLHRCTMMAPLTNRSLSFIKLPPVFLLSTASIPLTAE